MVGDGAMDHSILDAFRDTGRMSLQAASWIQNFGLATRTLSDMECCKE